MNIINIDISAKSVYLILTILSKLNILFTYINNIDEEAYLLIASGDHILRSSLNGDISVCIQYIITN